MPKTQEELNQLKQEVKQLNEKLKELTDEELNIVTGGLAVGDIAIMKADYIDVNF